MDQASDEKSSIDCKGKTCADGGEPHLHTSMGKQDNLVRYTNEDNEMKLN